MADDKDIADGEGGGSSKKKLLIIIAIVVVLLLGVGAAAVVLLGGEEPPPEPEPPVVEEGPAAYYKFDPAFVVNLPPGGPAGMMQIEIEVLTRSPTVMETLKTNDPMFRHYLLNLLENQQAAALMTLEGKQALQAAVSDLVAQKLKELEEPGEIKGVYFTQFVLQ